MNLIYRDITKIRRRQRNIKRRLSKIDRKLAAHEGGGEGRGMGHKNIAESQGGSDKFFRDTNKILQTPPGINNDRFLIITCVYMILSFVCK